MTVGDHVKAEEAPPPVPRRRVANPPPNPSNKRQVSVRDLEPTGPPDRTYKVGLLEDHNLWSKRS